jgi:hypothetical protein
MMHQFIYLVLGSWIGFVMGLFWSGMARADRFWQISRKAADLHPEGAKTHGWSNGVN